MVHGFNFNCQAMCPCVKKISKMDTGWHYSHFAPTPPHHPWKFFVSNERGDQNKSFFYSSALQCYGINFAPIKRFCQLSVCLSSLSLLSVSSAYLPLLSVFLFCLSFLFFLFVILSITSVCLCMKGKKCIFSKIKNICFALLNRTRPWRMSNLVFI